MKRVYYRPDIHDLNAHIDQFSSRLGEDGFSTSILIDERMKSTLSDSWQAVLQNSELKSTREQFSLYRYQLNR